MNADILRTNADIPCINANIPHINANRTKLMQRNFYGMCGSVRFLELLEKKLQKILYEQGL